MAGSELLRTLLLQASIAAVTSVPSQNTRTGPLLTLSLPCEYPDCKNIIRLFWLNLQKVSKLKNERECLLYKSQQSPCSGMPAPSIIIITRPRWLQLYFCWADSDLAARVRWQLKSEECWGQCPQCPGSAALSWLFSALLCSALCPPGW